MEDTTFISWLCSPALGTTLWHLWGPVEPINSQGRPLSLPSNPLPFYLEPNMPLIFLDQAFLFSFLKGWGLCLISSPWFTPEKEHKIVNTDEEEYLNPWNVLILSKIIFDLVFVWLGMWKLNSKFWIYAGKSRLLKHIDLYLAGVSEVFITFPK